jgi:rhomboid protease GluP
MLSPRLRWKLDQALARVREFFDSGKQEPKPQICFDCGRLVGAVETICSHCGANQSKASFSALKRVSLAVIPAENPVTYAFIFANLLFMGIAFFISIKSGSAPFEVNNQALDYLGAKWTPYILYRQEYWRLVMPILLHGGLIHLGFNTFVLWQIGPQVEELFGSQRFLFLYLVTGIAGFIASAWWSPYSASVGTGRRLSAGPSSCSFSG